MIKVTITETLERIIFIEGCDTVQKAEDRASELYYNGKIVLYPESCTSVGFVAEEEKPCYFDSEDLEIYDMEHDEPI